MLERIWCDYVAASLEFERSFNAVHLDLAAYAFGPLSPLELNGLQPVLFNDIFRNTQAGIFHVHLNQEFTVAAVIAFIDFDAAVHFRRCDDFVVLVQFKGLGRFRTRSHRTLRSGSPLIAAPTQVLPVLAQFQSVNAPVNMGRRIYFNVPTIFRFDINGGNIAVSGPAATPAGRPEAPIA